MGSGRRGWLTILEFVPAKGVPRCAAISPGMKGRGLRCPRSPWEIEAIGSFDSASRHQLRFLFGRSKLRPSRCGALGARWVAPPRWRLPMREGRNLLRPTAREAPGRKRLRFRRCRNGQDARCPSAPPRWRLSQLARRQDGAGTIFCRMVCKILGGGANRGQKGKPECRMSLTTRMSGRRRNLTTIGTIPIGGRIGTTWTSPTSSSLEIDPQAISWTVRWAFGGALGFAAEMAALHAGGPQLLRPTAGGGRWEMAVAQERDPPGEVRAF